MDNLIKICADSLRAFTLDNHGIKLKPSHAHELVAAFLGYKSKAALLADKQYPLSNLRQANYIVLHPTDLINERRKHLEDLPAELPDTYTLTEGVYWPLVNDKWLLSKPWPTPDLLATALADEYLRQQGMDKMYRRPVREGVKVKHNEDSVEFTVFRFYQIPTGGMIGNGPVHQRNMTTTIKLKRVAAHIGYAIPEISAEIEKLESLPS